MSALFRFLTGLFADVVRRRVSLVAENALLRQQLIVAQRKIVGRVRWAPWQRFTMGFATRLAPAWREAVVLVKPATILRWHRASFRVFWRRRSRSAGRPPTARAALIREMAASNPRWGAERLRGELLKLGIRVCKRTIQKYMRGSKPRGDGQGWSTFLRNHVTDDALAHVTIADALADRADDAGALIADDVRPRRDLASGAMQRIAALNADRTDVDEDTARVTDGVGYVFVPEHLGSTGLVVYRRFHAPDLEKWLRTAAWTVHVPVLYDGSAGAAR